MRYILLLLFAIFFSLFVLSCSSELKGTKRPPQEIKLPPGKEMAVFENSDWQKEWEKLVSRAKKENRVVVYSSLGSDQRIPMVAAFQEKFGFPLEFVAGRGEEMAAKIMAEKRAGLHLIDAYVGGPTTIYNVFKRGGLLIPLQSELILPEVKDPSFYWQKKVPFADIEGKYLIPFIATVSGSYVAINTDFIKRGELSSYNDLLSPKLKGKIIIQDPTTAGKGNTWFMGIMSAGKTLDTNYMKSLVNQEPFMTRDRRQQIESLARGKFWVSIANQSSTLKEFIALGTPIAEIRLKEDIDAVLAGSGNLVLMDKAPHPAAAKAFANWLLTREAQTIFARASNDQSIRIDVPTDHLSPEDVRKPGVQYFQEDEKFLLEAPKYLEMAKTLFGPLVK